MRALKVLTQLYVFAFHILTEPLIDPKYMKVCIWGTTIKCDKSMFTD